MTLITSSDGSMKQKKAEQAPIRIVPLRCNFRLFENPGLSTVGDQVGTTVTSNSYI